MRLYVCPLSHLDKVVAETGARHVITLINAVTLVTRPASVRESDHLFLGMHDIARPIEGHILPGQEHLERLLGFVSRWDRAAPLVVHCWAGISRSTAAAYITVCALNPARDEDEAAAALRAASPSATPNPRLIALADAHLGRKGRMIKAVERIGRGEDAFEGSPFAYDI